VNAFGGSARGSAAIVSTDTIQVMQYVLLALGAALSVYVARRIAVARHGSTARAKRVAIPFSTTVMVFAAVNAVLFMLPMAHRM
jgi:hypothetical protein